MGEGALKLKRLCMNPNPNPCFSLLHFNEVEQTADLQVLEEDSFISLLASNVEWWEGKTVINSLELA